MVVGGPAALAAIFMVKDILTEEQELEKTNGRKHFDWIGAFSYPLGIILLMLAMLQAVVPDPTLSQDGPLAGLIIGGCVSGLIFIVDQFFA